MEIRSHAFVPRKLEPLNRNFFFSRCQLIIVERGNFLSADEISPGLNEISSFYNSLTTEYSCNHHLNAKVHVSYCQQALNEWPKTLIKGKMVGHISLSLQYLCYMNNVFSGRHIPGGKE